MTKQPEQIYKRFTERYRNNCAGFAREICRMNPTWQQEQMFQAIVKDDARVSCRSGHGTGKSCSLAIILLWWLFARPMSRIIVTSGSMGTIQNSLWPETLGWFYRVANAEETRIFGHWFEATSRSIYHKTLKHWKCEVRAVRSENPQSIAGAHARDLLYLVEEASSLQQTEIFDVIDGALTGGPDNKLILVGNPSSNVGRFYESHHTRTDLFSDLLHWNSEESPLVSESAIKGFRDEYGKESREYKIRILGEFAPDESKMLISRDDVERCIQPSIELENPELVIGADVSGDGRDSSVVCLLEVQREAGSIVAANVLRLDEYRSLSDTMKFGYLLIHLSQDHDDCPIFIDAIGVGKGCTDRLKEMEAPAQGFIAGSKAFNPGRFYNQRAENFNALKSLIESQKISLPRNQRMIEQLSNLPFKYSEKGALQIERKDKFADYGLKSPDLADALMIGMCKSFLNLNAGNNLRLLEKLNESEEVLT
jgi:hypothetical protein